MGEHINADGQFQSDKYPWCKPGFVPLKITDAGAWQPLWDYAEQRRAIDAGFADDLQAALKAAGYVPPAADDDTTRCIACDKPLVAGDKYYPDASGGFLHADCCGPERECYTLNDEPPKDGDPIPEPYVWEDEPPLQAKVKS